MVVLTNVSLDHTEVLGETREAIAAEKLAVVRPGCTVVLGEPEWEGAARAAGAGAVVVAGRGPELAAAAAEAFLGAAGRPAPLAGVTLPGRLEARPGEIRDGAHNPGVSAGSSTTCPPRRLHGRRVDPRVTRTSTGCSGCSRRSARRFVACTSSNPRALAADELADARPAHFDRVEAVPEPRAALARGHALGEPVLVTGSLYLLGDLEEPS